MELLCGIGTSCVPATSEMSGDVAHCFGSPFCGRDGARSAGLLSDLELDDDEYFALILMPANGTAKKNKF